MMTLAWMERTSLSPLLYHYKKIQTKSGNMSMMSHRELSHFYIRFASTSRAVAKAITKRVVNTINRRRPAELLKPKEVAVDHVLFIPTEPTRGTSFPGAALPVKPSSITSCSNKASIFPSGRHYERSFMPRRRVISLPVSGGGLQLFRPLLTRTDFVFQLMSAIPSHRSRSEGGLISRWVLLRLPSLLCKREVL